MLFDTSKAVIEELHDDLFSEKAVRVSILRLDRIHPVVSGNKLFKLHYFLEDALASGIKTIISFGGAYSNHLAATAFACRVTGIRSIGIVRGEAPRVLSPTLKQCMEDGMHLKFISRAEYDRKEGTGFIRNITQEFGEAVIIPEGGFHPAGARGAALIYDLIRNRDHSDICMATGTATTLAGMCMAVPAGINLVGIPVLKGVTDISERLKQLTGTAALPDVKIYNNYHFGGYAKRTGELTSFMNTCWHKYKLPLDFVYTAKMLYGVTDLIQKGEFKKGSNILCLHTGGLQGNKSLPLNLLSF